MNLLKSEKSIGKRLRPLSGDWGKFTKLSDDEVRVRALTDRDAQPSDEALWAKARIMRIRPSDS